MTVTGALPGLSVPDRVLEGAIVERSVTGRLWHLATADDRLVSALAQRHGLPEIIARLLASRGVSLEEAERYLAPTLRAMMPDPSILADMDRAADRIATAIEAGETIGVFGDYDVDGATSTALLVRYLRALGVEAVAYIPDRQAEGYGPNVPALERLAGQGVRLLLTVDCGTTAHEAIRQGCKAGLDIIVLDHHTAEAGLPPAYAVVNPNRTDRPTPELGMLAACGVVFLALVAVNRVLRGRGAFAGRAEPNLLELLDLVALGTVADVVPLTGLNRSLVVQGLKVLAQRRNPGLVALAEVAGVAEAIEPYHLGFALGPRINAGGRLADSSLGCRLLATSDLVEAAKLAAELHRHNDDRREVEAAVLSQAIEVVEAARADGGGGGTVLLAARRDWHPGVIGIVAGRLKERYNRPACVVAIDGSGIGKASCRSMPGIDLGAAVLEARHAGLLIDGGGHPMAAGFTVEEGKLPALRSFLASHVAAQMAGPIRPMLQVDGTLTAGGASVALARMIERAGPFGSGNPEPVFLLSGVRVGDARVVGTSHVACRLSGGTGPWIKGIAFRALETALGEWLLTAGGAPTRLAGTLKIDRWQGQERIQFCILDAAPDGA